MPARKGIVDGTTEPVTRGVLLYPFERPNGETRRGEPIETRRCGLLARSGRANLHPFSGRRKEGGGYRDEGKESGMQRDRGQEGDYLV